MKKWFCFLMAAALLCLTACNAGGAAPESRTEPNMLSESDLFQQDGVRYLRLSAITELLGLQTGVYEGENFYSALPENGRFWSYYQDITEFEQGVLLADEKAAAFHVIQDKIGYRLQPGTTKTMASYMGGSYTSVLYPPLLRENGLFLSCEDAAWLFGIAVKQDAETGSALLLQGASLTDYAEQILRNCRALPQNADFSFEYDNLSIQHDRVIGVKDGLRYLYDLQGNQLTSTGYTTLSFWGEYGCVRFATESDAVGIMDDRGTVLINEATGYITKYSWLPYYWVMKDPSGERRYGLYDRTGKCIFEPVYERLGSLTHTGDAVDDLYNEPIFDDDRIGMKKDGKWGVGDLEGNIVLPIRYDALGILTEDGVLRRYVDENAAEKLLIVQKDGLYGAVDKNGVLVLPFSAEPL